MSYYRGEPYVWNDNFDMHIWSNLREGETGYHSAVRVDLQIFDQSLMSDRNRMFFDVRRTGYLQEKNNYFGNLSTGSLLTRSNWGSSFDDVFTVNSTNVIDLRLNFTRMDEAHPSPSAGFDPTSLGLPSYLASNSQYLQLPFISFATNSGFQALGSNGANKLPSQSAQLYATWTTIKGSHSIRSGVDARQYNLNIANYGSSVGNFGAGFQQRFIDGCFGPGLRRVSAGFAVQ